MNSVKTQTIEPPRIFISHAWEDKELVRRLEAQLKSAGAEVWVDHAGIRGGDNLPERINDALEWCNTLLLVWSKAAKSSHWVKLEWTNAISLRKLIVPCPIDGTPVPPILANTAYINFSDREQGVRELLRALQLAQTGGKDLDTESELAGVIHTRLVQAEAPTIPKPPQDEPKVSPPKTKPPVSMPTPLARPIIIQLRSTPVKSLHEASVKEMLREKNFYDSYWSKSGKGIGHEYESVERQSEKLVIDHATGLMWQQGGSDWITFESAEAHIRQLNAEKFGGYNGWRLPTLEEAMSLMEPKQHDNLYIDPVFDRQQTWIWTADKVSAGRAWFVKFNLGFCIHSDIGNSSSVRVVRSVQSAPSTIPKPPQDAPKAAPPKSKAPGSNSALQLRSQRSDNLSGQAVKAMLKPHNFYCAEYDWSKEWCNPNGQGIKHHFELQQDGQVIVDHATGLNWQQSGSQDSIPYADAEKYVRDLNKKRFADCEDWRLPTLEEAMSLMEREKKNGDLYIDPVFDRTQVGIWTADKESAGRAWYVGFSYGGCSHDAFGFDVFVRAVRS